MWMEMTWKGEEMIKSGLQFYVDGDYMERGKVIKSGLYVDKDADTSKQNKT